MRIGITGQAGFVGSHLSNYLKTKPSVEQVPFEDEYFTSEKKLCEFVQQCDVVVHLAAINRHSDEQVLHDTNIRLVEQLIAAMEKTNSTPHVLFSSSTHEEKNNLYGKSKRKGRELLSEWAKRHSAKFTGLVIPNVYGPFGKPYYNSVVATFCHQLTHNEQPEIDVDGTIRLIYVSELAEYIYNLILEGKTEEELHIPYSAEKKVSSILSLLGSFKHQYLDNGIIPSFASSFELSLFNTFRCYIDNAHYPVYLKKNTDARGTFVELIKLHTGGQVSYSTTKPSIVRGNHYHTRKFERFVVLSGEALIQLRKIDSDEVVEYKLSGDNPAYVDMPIWYTHNIRNIGKTDLVTLFWINELFDPNDPDTYTEPV